MVERSFFKKLGIHENQTLIQLLVEEYHSGRDINLTKVEKEYLKELENDVKGPVQEASTQKCNDLFLQVKYQGHELFWYEMFENENTVKGGYLYSTDYGLCCALIPQFLNETIFFDKNRNSGVKGKVDYSARHGTKNGLELLIDIERFNYIYGPSSGVGFKAALVGSDDFAIMR